MNLSDHDLRQLSGEKLRALPDEVVRGLSIKLLNDLKEARERLKQTSKTSSRPPRSDLPWGKGSEDEADAAESIADEFPGTGGLSDALKEKPAEDEDPSPAEPPAKSDVKTAVIVNIVVA